MGKSRYLLVEVVLIAVAVVGTALVYPHLPLVIPRHWGLDGRVNGYSPRWMIFVFGPGLMALFTVLGAMGAWLSPKQFSVENFRATYARLILILVCMMGYVELVIVWSVLQQPLDNPPRFVFGGVCMVVALAGNMLGKVRRNFIIGIRTPWTLANERVWNATHRFAAKMFVIAGLGGLVFVLCGWFRGSVTVVVVGAILPSIYSLAYYKKLERQGQL